jgi:hypothetical protein
MINSRTRSQSAPSRAKTATRVAALRASRRSSARLTCNNASRSASMRAISNPVTFKPLRARWLATVLRRTSRRALNCEVGESSSSIGTLEATAETASNTRCRIQALKPSLTMRCASGSLLALTPKRSR